MLFSAREKKVFSPIKRREREIGRHGPKKKKKKGGPPVEDRGWGGGKLAHSGEEVGHHQQVPGEKGCFMPRRKQSIIGDSK